MVQCVSKYMLVLGIVVLMFGCSAPNTKENYLERFERFVSRVEKNHKEYNKKDWEYTDERFEKYNKEWYLKFSDEFTLNDQIKIKGCIIRYHACRNKNDIGEMLKQIFKEDVDDIHKSIKEYVEKDLDADLEKIIEGATAIGDSAVKVLEDAITKFEDSF